MGKYTIHDDQWIDKYIEENHLKILNEVASKNNDIISILLQGGFGHGEGSVKIINSSVIPFHDYDIYIIIKDSTSKKSLQNLRKRLKKRIKNAGYTTKEYSQNFYFDITFFKLKTIQNALPKFLFYDIKHGSYLLYGEDVRKLIPDFNIKDFSVYEGIRSIFTKLSPFTIFFSNKYFKKVKLDNNEKDMLLYRISGLYCAMCILLTQISYVYSVSYRKRLKNLKKIYSKKFIKLDRKMNNLLKKIEYFTKLKLNPDYYKNIKSDEAISMWFTAKNDIIIFLEYIFKKFNINSFDEFYSKSIKKFFKPYLKRLIEQKKMKFISNKFMLNFLNIGANILMRLNWFKKILSKRKKLYLKILCGVGDPGLQIFESLLFLIKSIKDDGEIDENLLNIAYQRLKIIYPFEIKNKKKMLDELKNAYKDAWRLYWDFDIMA